jgi:hypothetical protein
MADQVEVTPDAEYIVSTDDAGASGQVQRVKLALSADGSAAHAQVDADGVLVNLGANNDVTVSGVATAANQATLIGHVDTLETLLAAIRTAVEILDNVVAGSEAQVDVLTMPTTTVQATDFDIRNLSSATDSVTAVFDAGDINIGNVDVLTVPADPFGVNADAASTAGGAGSIQAKLRLVTTQLDAIKTAVEALDNTVGGSELQVDVVGALPVGNNNIGDVDVASSVLPSGASTSAKQDTIIGHVDGVETLLGGGLPSALATDRLKVDGSGVTQPVSHAALTELAAAIDTELQVDVVGPLPAGTNNIGDVDVASSVLPTGAATETKQDTQIGHLDGVEGLLTTIDADTGAMVTALQILDNIVSGNEAQVDVLTLPALPAGNNNIGDVDVASVAGTVATKESRAATSALTTVADNAASTSILASNANRLKAIITNDSSARLYLRFEAAAASTSNYGVSLAQHETWEEFNYTGEIRGIWASDPGDGAARVTEFTA